MFKVHKDPYNEIGKFTRDHLTVIEDMIAVIEINGVIKNELFMVDLNEDGYFVWKHDWWEGEENVTLLDFFSVSDAQSPSAQPEIIRCKDCKYGDTFHEFDEPDMPMKCLGQHYGGTYPDDFCSYAERRTNGVDS